MNKYQWSLDKLAFYSGLGLIDENTHQREERWEEFQEAKNTIQVLVDKETSIIVEGHRGNILFTCPKCKEVIFLDESEIMSKYNKETTNTVPLFHIGETVIYRNGDNYELGVVKEVCKTDHNGKTSYKYLVYYHTGDTSTMTDEYLLHKIVNSYAFEIRRKRGDEA